MNNTLSEATRPTRFNSNRGEISKDQKGTGKTANGALPQLASNGFDSSQITGVLDKVSGNLQQRPWEDCCGGKPTLECAIGQSIDLKPIIDLKPSIDLKPIIDKPAKPITDLIDIIKPAKPFPGFPLPGPVIPRPPGFPQPEVELADPGLTDAHNTANAAGNIVDYEDVDGEIFVGGTNDIDSIDLSDIDQGRVANCYLMAAIGSIAHNNPEFIANMITDNGNGTYTVSFGGALGDVTIDDDFAVFTGNGNAAYAGFGDGETKELWVAIIEKAYVQANMNTEGGNVRDGTYQGIGWGNSSTAIANITGQASTSSLPSAHTPESLEAALDNRQSVILSSLGESDKTDRTPDGLFRSHAYVLSEVKQNADGEWVVVVFNPHGTDLGTQDPYTELTMEQFNTNFRAVEMTNEPVG